MLGPLEASTTARPNRLRARLSPPVSENVPVSIAPALLKVDFSAEVSVAAEAQPVLALLQPPTTTRSSPTSLACMSNRAAASPLTATQTPSAPARRGLLGSVK